MQKAKNHMQLRQQCRALACALLCACLLVVFLAGCGGSKVQQPLRLGEQYLLDGKYEEALLQFLQVIEIDPSEPRGYGGAAEAYMHLGRTTDAIAILEQGVAATGDAELQEMLDGVRQALLDEEAAKAAEAAATGLRTADEDAPAPTVLLDAAARDEVDALLDAFVAGDYDAAYWILADDAFREGMYALLDTGSTRDATSLPCLTLYTSDGMLCLQAGTTSVNSMVTAAWLPGPTATEVHGVTVTTMEDGYEGSYRYDWRETLAQPFDYYDRAGMRTEGAFVSLHYAIFEVEYADGTRSPNTGDPITSENAGTMYRMTGTLTAGMVDGPAVAGFWDGSLDIGGWTAPWVDDDENPKPYDYTNGILQTPLILESNLESNLVWSDTDYYLTITAYYLRFDAEGDSMMTDGVHTVPLPGFFANLADPALVLVAQ